MKIISISKHPTFLLVVGATLISFSGVWVKLAEVSSSSSAFYRVFFGCIFLLFFTLRAKDYRSYTLTHYLLASLCGLLFAFDLLCWHNSIQRVGPGLATLLGNFQVFILAGAGILFFKEQPGPGLIISIPLALIGLFFIIGPDWANLGNNYKTGIYYGLATALFYSSYLLSLRHLSKVSTSIYFSMSFLSLVSAIILALFMLSTGDPFAIPDFQSFISLASLGLFSQCIGWLLITVSLPRNKASITGLILLLQPALSFIWDVLFFARPTSVLNWAGVSLALFAIYLGLATKQKKS